MTRITKTLISVVAASAMALGAGSSAVAYTSANAELGDQQSAAAPQGDRSSVNATLGSEQSRAAPQGDQSSVTSLVGDRAPSQPGASTRTASTSPSSPSSILGPDGSPSPTPVSSAPASGSDGFHWVDAVIGAGIAFALASLAALTLVMARRRTRVEPSV